MSIKPFSLGQTKMFQDPDTGNDKLQIWLDELRPLYLQSPEHQSLSKVNQKAAGQWFDLFMDLHLNYIGTDLKDLNIEHAEEIMLELLPQKLACSDTQVKTIVPDILAYWQFLDREFNHGSKKKLKHSRDIIAFLKRIKKGYLDIYNSFYENDDEDDEVFLPMDFSGNHEDYQWVMELIQETATHFTSIHDQSPPPENWHLLGQYSNLAEFLQQICTIGFDQSPTQWLATKELLNFACTDLFMQIRQGDQNAIRFWREMESNIIGAHLNDLFIPEAMAILEPVLVSHKQFLSPEFMNFIQQWHLEYAEELTPEQRRPEMMQEMLCNIMDGQPDEFVATSLLKEKMGFLPSDSFQPIFGMLLTTGEKGIDSTGLMLLDDNPENATAIAETLNTKPDLITPKTLSRLIRFRNWLIPEVKAIIDPLIRNVRKKGVQPLSPNALKDEDILEVHMSGVDGRGAQGVAILVRCENSFRLIHFILKEAIGIVDVVVSPLSTKTHLNQILRHINRQLGNVEKVSPALIKQLVPYFIALNLKSQVAIDHELVQALELLGVDNWHPEANELSCLYSGLKPKAPSMEDVEQAQKRSKNWINSAIGNSWFEMPDTFKHLTPISNEQDHRRLFIEVMEKRRKLWGERMGRMALWCQYANSKRRQQQVQDFAIVSWLLEHSDLPVHDINLIKEVVKKSL